MEHSNFFRAMADDLRSADKRILRLRSSLEVCGLRFPEAEQELVDRYRKAECPQQVSRWLRGQVELSPHLFQVDSARYVRDLIVLEDAARSRARRR